MTDKSKPSDSAMKEAYAILQAYLSEIKGCELIDLLACVCCMGELARSYRDDGMAREDALDELCGDADTVNGQLRGKDEAEHFIHTIFYGYVAHAAIVHAYHDIDESQVIDDETA